MGGIEFGGGFPRGRWVGGYFDDCVNIYPMAENEGTHLEIVDLIC